MLGSLLGTTRGEADGRGSHGGGAEKRGWRSSEQWWSAGLGVESTGVKGNEVP